MSQPNYSDMDREALLRMLKLRDHQAEQSRKYWIRAAEAALNGDPRELHTRVQLAKTKEFNIVHAARWPS